METGARSVRTGRRREGRLWRALQNLVTNMAEARGGFERTYCAQKCRRRLKGRADESEGRCNNWLDAARGTHLVTNSLAVAQKLNRICPSRRQHPGNPCRHRRSNTRRSRQYDRILDGIRLFDATTYGKLDKKVAEAHREEMKHFEAMGVHEKKYRTHKSTSRRPPNNSTTETIKQCSRRHLRQKH